MKNKFIYQDGEKLANPKCPCPRIDKSECFKIFMIAQKDNRYAKKGEFDYWKVECPYFSQVNRMAASTINKILSQ